MEKDVKKEESKVDSEAKEVDSKVQEIVDKITASLAEKKESKEAKEKKKALVSDVKMVDKEITLFTKFDRKLKKERAITMRKSEMEQCSKWFQCMLQKDVSGMKEIKDKLNKGVLLEGTAALGGNLVPTLLANFLTEILDDEAVMRSRANLIDMSGMMTNQLDISSIAAKPAVYWTGENVDKSTTSMEFGQIALTPYKLAAIITISMELRDDSPFNIVQIVSKQLAQAIAREEDRVFFNGTGVAQPTGIDTYVLRATNCGGALTWRQINTAYYGLPQAYRKNAYWFMNGRIIERINNFQDANNRPILQNSGILSEPGVPMLLGRPVLEQNDINQDRIFFGDPSNYHIATKGPLDISISEEAVVSEVSLWERNLIGIRVEERIDGELAPQASFYELNNL